MSGHAVRQAPDTGRRKRCPLRGEGGTHTSCRCLKNGVWWVSATGESTYKGVRSRCAPCTRHWHRSRCPLRGEEGTLHAGV